MREDLKLGIDNMDKIHTEFFEMLETLKMMKGSVFLEGFANLIVHTQEHFAQEEALMRENRFYGIQEHLDEHENLLGEMRYFYDKGKKMLPFAENYINEYVFEKFRRHIINIDSQFAMFLKTIPQQY